LFLGKDGDIEPIYLWRQRLAPLLPSSVSHDLLPSSVSHDLESGGAEEAGDAALKALFVQRGLGAMCVDVCRELGVESVDDLSYVTLEHVDELPNYLKDQLKGVRRNKLLALLGLKPRVGGQHKEAAHAVTLANSPQQSAAASRGAAPTHAAASGASSSRSIRRIKPTAEEDERKSKRLRTDFFQSALVCAATR